MATLAGKFLVARPVLKDPNFARAVLLLLQHGDGGAFGLVLNRQAAVKGLPFPVFTGGPCPSQGLLMLHGHADWLDDAEERAKGEVARGIFLGDTSCLGRVSDPPAGVKLHFRMFTGYSGWGPGQLEGEIASGAWAVESADGDLLFDTPPEDLWVHLAPPAIPQFSLN